MTKPSYSHRNGEKEPPTVEGGYFFLGFYAGKIWNYFFLYDGTHWDAEGSDTVTRIDDEWEIEFDKMDGHWWGPVPLPWEGIEQDTLRRWMADIIAANGVSA